MATDYYELLGVSRTATQDEIKRAFRQLARQLHPDTGHGDPESEARFKQVAHAYEVLSDPEKRRRYDTFGPDGVNGAATRATRSGSAASATCSRRSSAAARSAAAAGARGAAPGSDLEVVVDLEFTEAVFGCEHPVSVRTAVECPACDATGAADGTQPVTCYECQGTGQVQRVRQSLIGQMVTSSPCARCAGSGQIIASPCSECRGEGARSRSAPTPSRSRPGSTPARRCGCRAGARSAPGRDGRRPLRPPAGRAPRAVRARRLRPPRHAALPYTQATLGATIQFETLDGTEEIDIPRATEPGTTFRLRNRGVPHLERRSAATC